MAHIQDRSALLRPPTLDLDPFSDEVLTTPYPFFAQLRQAPVVHIAIHNFYAVGRYEEVGIVASDFERFTTTGGVGLSDIRKPGAWRAPSPISEIDPPVHTGVRAALQKILSPLVVRQWRETFEKTAEAIVEDIVAAASVDGVRDIAEEFVLTAFPRVFGVSVPKERMKITGELNFNQLGPNNERLQRAMKAAEPILDWYADALQRHNMLPGGFGEKIYLAEDKGEFAEGTAPFHVRSFFRAGVDTTISGIGTTLRLLAQHPEQFAKVKADPSKVRHAFEEALRLESPAMVMFRTATQDVDFGGYLIPADAKVGYYAGAANRDPSKWQDPDTFDLDRQAAGVHRAFGYGAHVCIGQMISRLEAESILTALIKRIDAIELAGEPTYRLVNTLRTLDQLPLRLTIAR